MWAQKSWFFPQFERPTDTKWRERCQNPHVRSQKKYFFKVFKMNFICSLCLQSFRVGCRWLFGFVGCSCLFVLLLNGQTRDAGSWKRWKLIETSEIYCFCRLRRILETLKARHWEGQNWILNLGSWTLHQVLRRLQFHVSPSHLLRDIIAWGFTSQVYLLLGCIPDANIRTTWLAINLLCSLFT